MMNSVASLLSGILLSLVVLAEQNPAVKLIVKHNGRTRPAPDRVVLKYDNQVRELTVKEGRFDVPPEVLHSRNEIGFSTDVDGFAIHTAVYPAKFTNNAAWTLVLEDRQFGPEFQPLPKGSKARSSCGIIFDADATEGTVMFDPHCRTKEPHSMAAPKTQKSGSSENRPSQDPRFTHADVPFYPHDAQLAHITGTVEVQVTVKAGHVADTVVKSGQPILARATVENIKNWVFQSDVNDTFTTKFIYEMEDEAMASVQHANPKVDTRTCDPRRFIRTCLLRALQQIHAATHPAAFLDPAKAKQRKESVAAPAAVELMAALDRDAEPRRVNEANRLHGFDS